LASDKRTSNAVLNQTDEASHNGTHPTGATDDRSHVAGALVGPRPHFDLRPLQDWRALRRWAAADARTWGYRITSPLAVLVVAALLTVGLGGYGLGRALAGNATGETTAGGSSSGMQMGGAPSAATPASVPNATQDFGNQLAKYTMDPDGAKHFTMTTKQVMWAPVKGQRVLAWTFDGTVPGPMIQVTAGDHVRITIVNHLPEPTSIHWHGLEIPSAQDGVPGVGQQPIQPGKSFTYDFTIQDQDAGTHFYHSHYDDLRQVSGGLYGAFLVAPRPGSAEAKQAIHADVEYTEMISELSGYFVLNGKSFPDTQPILVKHGQTVRLRLINIGEMIHPMHLHGHIFMVRAEGGQPLAQPYAKDTLAIAPGETYDVTFDAWAAPGSVYPFHCHILSHVMNPGQMGDEMGGLIALVQYAQ
jgi:FtsP/CotA-like multicopper oxidase with cupredoxin domain